MKEKAKNIKKQIFELWKGFESRLLESDSFNILREKYQSLDVLHQKLLQRVLALFLLFALLAWPLYWFFSSVFYWGEFKSTQDLNSQMLKMRKTPSIFRYSKSNLKNKIERIVKKYTSSEFQIKDKKSLFLKNSSIYQVDFNIRLNHLNIKQVARLGAELNRLSQSRLSAITMEENKKYPQHYDVAYRLSAFISETKRGTFRPKTPRTIPLKGKSLKGEKSALPKRKKRKKRTKPKGPQVE